MMVKRKIALGLGNAVDYELDWNAALLEALIAHHKIQDAEISPPNRIDSERNLVLSILSFLRSGSGGECFVDDSSIIEEFVSHYGDNYKIMLGGTPVRAALAMQNLQHSHDIVLHLTTVNDHVRRLLPKDCRYICSNEHDTQSPHLIVQFESGGTVSAGAIHLTAPQSNRIIYLNDTDNTIMKIDAKFKDEVNDVDVVLISGFNAMQSKSLLKDRLDLLNSILSSSATTFYEDGGFYDPDFCQIIFAHPLLQKIQIVSMNEDEMQSHLQRKVNLLHASDMACALQDLKQRIPAQHIVVHTQYWALCYGENAKIYKHSLQGGITMGTTRYCHGDDFTTNEYNAIGTLSPSKDGQQFADQLETCLGNAVCCVPVAQIHEEPATATTVGLGDAFVGGFLLALVNDKG